MRQPLLCRYHHRVIHLDGHRITITPHAAKFEFTTPQGTRLDPLPAPPKTTTDPPRDVWRLHSLGG